MYVYITTIWGGVKIQIQLIWAIFYSAFGQLGLFIGIQLLIWTSEDLNIV